MKDFIKNYLMCLFIFGFLFIGIGTPLISIWAISNLFILSGLNDTFSILISSVIIIPGMLAVMCSLE